VLSTIVETPAGLLELHNVHIPPAKSRGAIKAATCEALYERLSRPSDRHRVLCGDFNTPKLETVEGDVITFAEEERLIVCGLAEWDLADVFRQLNGYERRDVSWVFHTQGRRKSGHRLDHILASSSLNAEFCDYQHGWRDLGLSDHSGMECLFAPAGHGRTAP
jgi:exonuclease III